MSKKSDEIKKLIITCFALILLGSFSFVFLSAHEMDKKTDKEDLKSASAKSISWDHQDKKEAAEDIKPPEGEQWYEPGDEEIYTLKLNIEKPSEGITGGKLIYFGLYIEPPYKVEVKDHSIFVNSINISTSPKGLFEKIDKRKQARKEDHVPELSLDIKKETEFADNLSKILRSKQQEIFKEHNSDYEANTEVMDKEFKEYLQTYPGIVIVDYCDFRNVFVRYRLPSGELSGVYLISCYCLSVRQKKAQDLMWENQFKDDYKLLINTLSNSIVICEIGGIFYDHDKSSFVDLCNILGKPTSREHKIAKMYSFLKQSSVTNAKLYYYNFDPVKFGCKELNDEKK